MLKVHAPYDLSVIEQIPLQEESYVDNCLQTAHDLFTNRRKWLSQPERIAIIEKCAHLVADRQDEFALAAAREGGKPLVDSKVELARAVQGIHESAVAISELRGREIPMNLNAASKNRLAYTKRGPIGPVVSVSAFNHPFNLIVHQVLPAIAVGCPVIIKPALTTPLSCFNLVECLYEAGLPKEWCQIVVCENEAAQKLVTDSRVAFFSFIGSAKVGWHLRSMLAPGTRCALEHGGSAPVIVEPDAAIEEALPLLAKGGFYHAGQVCVSVQRIFAHENCVEKITDGLCTAAKKLTVGDPTKSETEVGPLILEREVDRVDSWVKEAASSGGKILCGGSKIGNTCYEPTVILNPSAEVKLSREEIFGPVIAVYSYSDCQEAIDRANNVDFSFQAAVFTKNLDRALDCVNRLNAAAVMVNDHTAFRVDWMPFAGYKASGLGVGGILPTMEEMTQEKLMVIKSPVL